LKKLGILLTEGRHDRRRTVVYRMNMELLKNGFPEDHERVRQTKGSPDEGFATRTHIGSPDEPNTSFNRQEETPIVPLEDIEVDFDKLWEAWKPFEMLHGDRGQAERKYAKIRGEGVSAGQVLLAARVYCQQCKNTRCKTKHLENWLGSCVWKPEGQGLGEEANGQSGDEKPGSLRHQAWKDAVKAQLGAAVYGAWISGMWLEGENLFCCSKFKADWVQQHYQGIIVDAMGHQVKYLPSPPPPHAFADHPLQPPTGENHDQDQATA
jgi:hypothetical protein